MSHNIIKKPPPAIWRPPEEKSYVIPKELGRHCDVCLEKGKIFGFKLRLEKHPLTPEDHTCYICESCLGDDGGAITDHYIDNGTVVYRIGSSPTGELRQPWAGRIVIVPISATVH